MTAATIYHPHVISIPANPYGELARWTLDRLAIPYQEELRASGLATFDGGERDRLLVDTGDTTLRSTRELVEYYDARSAREQQLFRPLHPAKSEIRKYFDLVYDTFGGATLTWFAASGHAMTQDTTIATQQQVIERIFAELEPQVADGRRFLFADTFTAADLALAAMASPILLPLEYPCPAPNLSDLPPEMRTTVRSWRARPLGQFILRLYREHRPPRAPDLVAQGKHASGHTFKDRLANFLIGPGFLRPFLTLFRNHAPILVLGKTAVVTRYDDVVEVLKRDGDFTIKEVNQQKIDDIDGPFLLSMNASPQYDRENTALHEVVRREDLEMIRAFVAQTATQLVDAVRPRRRIDVVGGLARVVAVRLVASYFGMPGPNEPTMMRWMRDVFHYIFADVTSAEEVKRDALKSSSELRRYMDAQIALRKSRMLAKPESAVVDRPAAVGDVVERPSQDHNDDVLSRLLALQATTPWLDDDAVRRNLGGVIVGAVDTTSKFVALAIDELLRRPKPLMEARQAALNGDIEAVRRYAWEAVRFNPHHPLQVRFCRRATSIASGQRRSKTIPAETKTYVATLSGMFDPSVFENPGEFNANRTTEYLHFGYGMHACFGRAINGVQIPELLAALLRLPGLRRAPGDAGHILYDGPFPDRLILEFDA